MSDEEKKKLYDTGTNALLMSFSDNFNNRIDDLVNLVTDNRKHSSENDGELFKKVDRLTDIQAKQANTLSSVIKDLVALTNVVGDISKAQSNCKFNNGEFHDDYNNDLKYLKFINKCFADLKSSLITVIVVAFLIKLVNSIPFDQLFDYIKTIL